MVKSSRSSPWRGDGAVLALIVGGSLTYVAASSPVAWGMILGSGVELGGDAGRQWLMNLTEGLVALGVLVGGRLIDRRRLITSLGVALLCLALGVVMGWRGHTSGGATIIGLGLVASFGAGMLMALAVVVVATRLSSWRCLLLGLTLCGGLVLVELIWGSASMLSLSRGAAWVLGQVAWIGPLAGAVGGGLLILGDKLAVPPQHEAGSESSTLPLWGPPPTSKGGRASENPSFWILAALALTATFSGLMAQRSGAALSLIGLPDESFASGVLVGFTFAMARAGGALVGGLVHDTLGPRIGTVVTSVGIAVTLVVLSSFTGYDNPWRPLMGAVGVTCGLALSVAPGACVHLFGREHLGFHFGFLYLAIAFGNVLVLPLQATIESHPQAALIITAALCVGIGVSAVRWLRRV